MIAALKSDNADAVGQHCFTRAGLGCAPFTVTGFAVMKFQEAPDAPVRPGTSCDYCNTAIMYVCHIRSADGNTFKVGCDCVNRTGDAGLIKAYKTTKEYRAHQKAVREAKDTANQQTIERFLADPVLTAHLEAQTFTTSWGTPTNKLEAAKRSLAWCGAKGRAEWLAIFRKLVKEGHASPVS